MRKEIVLTAFVANDGTVLWDAMAREDSVTQYDTGGARCTDPLSALMVLATQLYDLVEPNK